nr:MAG TPA: hypothetical protein [Caudoviricetes sp.]
MPNTLWVRLMANLFATLPSHHYLLPMLTELPA